MREGRKAERGEIEGKWGRKEKEERKERRK